MKYVRLVDILGEVGFFDLATVVQLTGERRETIRTQLHRWCKSGKLLPLRRGMYAFPKSIRTARINPAFLANKLYIPSYLSTYWALGYYGMIPEKVVTYTSVTTRVPRLFSNAFGTFRYRSVKAIAFFGYKSIEIEETPVTIAEPEKALLDLWHFEKSPWGAERMMEMRFQNAEAIRADTLLSYAEKYRSPRLVKAAQLWIEVCGQEDEGAMEL